MAQDKTSNKSVNILVGVGGTGAKTVEAALVLMAAGMVDQPVYVGLVDQDAANGNVARTDALLKSMVRLRKRWTGGDNAIDWNQWGRNALGANRIYPLMSKENDDEVYSVYRPNSAATSLDQMLQRGLTPMQKNLFDMLFIDDENEQKMQLDEGYRGRAHVGSAAFAYALSARPNGFFDAIQRITEEAQGQSVNVFFVGSSFGGTGAAGFPTLARHLHNLRSSEKPAYANVSKTHIGGMLMLPYFGFGQPEDKNEVAVTADELLPKAQMALEYYHSLFEKEQSFDMFYTMGWNDIFSLGYHEPGSELQSNPALPPELIAATAAVDFFRKMDVDSTVDKTRIHMSARKVRALDWGDLPRPTDGDDREYEMKLSQLIRFCVYWKYFFYPLLAKPVAGFFGRAMAGKNLAHELSAKHHPDSAPKQMESFNEVVDGILKWAATLEAMAGKSGGGQNLWRLQPFVDTVENPKTPVVLKPADRVGDWQLGFNDLIQPSSDLHRSADQIFEELSHATISRNHNGMGKAIVAVYEACGLLNATANASGEKA